MKPGNSSALNKAVKRLRTWDAVAKQDRAEHGELLRAMRRVRERIALQRPIG